MKEIRHTYEFDTPEGLLTFKVERIRGVGEATRRLDVFNRELDGEPIPVSEVIRLVETYDLPILEEQLP